MPVTGFGVSERGRSEPSARTTGRARVGVAIAAVLVLLGIAGAIAIALRHTPPTDTQPYNVLFISLDTVRQDVLGCYGHKPRHAATLSTSPAVDALAADGVRMVDAYASSSWTLPSHISMMTGLPPLEHAVETEAATLEPAVPTMAEILRAHGYRTVGVYSAPYLDGYWGFARGFDEYRPVYGAEVVAATQRWSQVHVDIESAVAAQDWARYDDLKRELARIDVEMNDASQTVVTSEEVAATVVSQLEQLAQRTRPWLVFAHFFDAHCDYVPPPPFDTRFDPSYAGSFSGKGCMGGPLVARPDPDAPGGLLRTIGDRDLEHAFALYEGEVGWVDAHVGKILATLDRLGLARRTLVVVVADHGEEFFEHGGLGHRRTLYEEAIRAPMVLRLPGVLPQGRAVRGVVSIVDLLPTILDLLAIPHPSSPSAASFLPLIRGETDGRERVALSRFVMMFGGDVQVDGTEHVPLRQIIVEDAFRRGAIKVIRTRSWPQFRAGLRPEIEAVLRREAAAQYTREQLQWIDVEGNPTEPLERWSTDFSQPEVRATLAAFREGYADRLSRRTRRQPTSKLPQNIRLELESLGYLERSTGPQFPEPDIALPPPAMP